MFEKNIHGYHQVDDGAEAPLRKPLAQVRRDDVEMMIESGIDPTAIQNSGLATETEIQAYFSAADAVHPEDVAQTGGPNAA